MDQTFLVKAGKALVQTLTSAGFPPRAAVWVYKPELDMWKLWIVPHPSLTDKREFYRRIATSISENPTEMADLDAGDVEMVSADHPAIEGLSKMFRVVGAIHVRISDNVLNGFYLPDGIVLHLNLEPEPAHD